MCSSEARKAFVIHLLLVSTAWALLTVQPVSSQVGSVQVWVCHLWCRCCAKPAPEAVIWGVQFRDVISWRGVGFLCRVLSWGLILDKQCRSHVNNSLCDLLFAKNCETWVPCEFSVCTCILGENSSWRNKWRPLSYLLRDTLLSFRYSGDQMRWGKWCLWVIKYMCGARLMSNQWLHGMVNSEFYFSIMVSLDLSCDRSPLNKLITVLTEMVQGLS